jgi:hypothetical protein
MLGQSRLANRVRGVCEPVSPSHLAVDERLKRSLDSLTKLCRILPHPDHHRVPHVQCCSYGDGDGGKHSADPGEEQAELVDEEIEGVRENPHEEADKEAAAMDMDRHLVTADHFNRGLLNSRKASLKRHSTTRGA